MIKPLLIGAATAVTYPQTVGAFAINAGLIDKMLIPENGIAIVRIWQVNISKTIIAHIPICNGQVQECGDFELDGVTFPARRD
ncbi:PrpF domain-containing protein [Psychromonas sp. KJ10-10]|uniref:PrpF domain-containing protein n=1 Tax=Psychromonas sp. KJ10-10 TaxID=3391823 RepID=UPI0039B474E8